jgi:hypothetical protein
MYIEGGCDAHNTVGASHVMSESGDIQIAVLRTDGAFSCFAAESGDSLYEGRLRDCDGMTSRRVTERSYPPSSNLNSVPFDEGRRVKEVERH